MQIRPRRSGLQGWFCCCRTFLGIGHSLGLYHIFRGISEIQSCSDPCMETEPSFETGDLCSDTNPAPKHKFCGDPGPGNDTCGFNSLFTTPYNNFMSWVP